MRSSASIYEDPRMKYWLGAAGIVALLLVGFGLQTQWTARQPDNIDLSDTSPALAQQVATTPVPPPAEHVTVKAGEGSAKSYTLKQIGKLSSLFEQRLEIYRLAETLAFPDLLTTLDHAQHQLADDIRPSATNILFSRLAELDADAAVDAALQRPHPSQAEWLQAIFEVWLRTAPASAVARAETLSGMHRTIVQQTIYRSRPDLLARRPSTVTYASTIQADSFPTAWQKALEITNRSDRLTGLQILLMEWAASDAAAAIAAAETGFDETMRPHMQGMVAGIWVGQDLDAASAWINSQPNLEQLLQGLAYELKDLDLASQLAASLDEKHGDALISSTIYALAPDEPAEVERWTAAQTDEKVRKLGLQALAYGKQLNTESPADMLGWLDSLNASDAAIVEESVLGGLVHKTPHLVIARLPEVSDDGVRSSLTYSLVQKLVKDDPLAAAALTADAPTEDRAKLYRSLTKRWARQDRDAALKFARGLTDPDARNNALIGIMRSDSKADPTQILGELSDTKSRREIAAKLRELQDALQLSD